MTAEIAVMNKQAIALAADSAVTLSGGEGSRKIFTSANKIFTLSKYHPVSIMLYGNSMFMDVPWETIIKAYRSALQRRPFDTIEEYANDFRCFLLGSKSLFPESQQKRYVMQNVSGYFYHIARRISDKLAEKDQPSENEVKRTTSRHIKDEYDMWEASPFISDVTKRDVTALIRKYRAIIDKAKEDIFQNLTKTASKQLTKIAGNIFMKFPGHVLSPQESGIVIAGFGSKEIFPALQAFSVEGIANDILKHRLNTSVAVDMQTPGAIVPFAQREMVQTFMEGIEPDYQSVVSGYLSTLFEQYPAILVDSIDALGSAEKVDLKEKLKEISKEVLNEFEKTLKIYRTENYVEPVVTVVSHLPKDELAEMAESLVNLTKFKRKVSMQEETVGGAN